MARIRECMEEGDAADGELRLPSEVVREGSKVVKRELEKVVVIDLES
jgi:hypothetical protein